jgi:hypothetical protein
MPQAQPGLNGIWQEDGGGMIAIYNGRFVWSDGRQTAFGGRMSVAGDRLTAYAVGSDTPIEFQVRLQGDRFFVQDASGQVLGFTRLY